MAEERWLRRESSRRDAGDGGSDDEDVRRGGRRRLRVGIVFYSLSLPAIDASFVREEHGVGTEKNHARLFPEGIMSNALINEYENAISANPSLTGTFSRPKSLPSCRAYLIFHVRRVRDCLGSSTGDGAFDAQTETTSVRRVWRETRSADKRRRRRRRPRGQAGPGRQLMPQQQPHARRAQLCLTAAEACTAATG